MRQEVQTIDMCHFITIKYHAVLLDFLVLRYGTIQGGPEKNGTGYFPQYVDSITGISV